MRLALFGVGQAGGKVTDAVLEYADRTHSDSVVAGPPELLSRTGEGVLEPLC